MLKKRFEQSPTLVIVPTFRERANIGRLWEQLSAARIPLDLLVIDDGSDDGTSECLQQLMTSDPRVSLLQRPRKLGLGTAYTLALAFARDRGYQRVVQMDADGSHDTDDVMRLVRGCHNNDLAIGSRYVPGGECGEDWPWRRRMLSTWANWLVSTVLRLGIRDATGGFRCTRGRLLKRLPLERLVSRGFGWQWEFNRAAVAAGARVTEVPIRFRQRVEGASKMSLGIMIESLSRLAMVRCGLGREVWRPEVLPTLSVPRRPVILSRREALGVIAVGACTASTQLLTSKAIAGELDGRSTSPIETAYVDRSSPYDPGTIVAVLRNTGEEPLEISRVSVNGVALREWPAATDPVAWHRLSSHTIAAGQRVLLTAKLSQYTSGLLRLTVDAGSSSHSQLLTAAKPEPVRVAALRYDRSGRGINIFLENVGGKADALQEVLLSGASVWQGELTLRPGEVTPMRLVLDRTLRAGERVTLLFHLPDRVLGVTDRAVPGFRISVEAGDQQMAQRIAADPLVLETYKFEQEQIDHAGDAAPSLAIRHGAHWSMVKVSHGRFLSEQESDLACVFACPTHSTDCYQTAAYLASKAQLQAEQRPAWQTFIHCCRTQPLAGIAVFGAVADAVRFNAALTTDVSVEDPHRDKNPSNVYRMTRYAARAASPSVAMPMIMLQQDWKVFPLGAPLDIEARQMIYAALAGGAGGISYRVRQEKWGRENREVMLEEVKQVNHELRQIRDLLALGYPRDLASCEVLTVQVEALDALPRALVLVVINHDLERSPPELLPFVRAVEKQKVALALDEDACPKQPVLWRIRGEQRERVEWLKQIEGRWIVQLPTLGAAELLVLASQETPETELFGS